MVALIASLTVWANDKGAARGENWGLDLFPSISGAAKKDFRVLFLPSSLSEASSLFSSLISPWISRFGLLVSPGFLNWEVLSLFVESGSIEVTEVEAGRSALPFSADFAGVGEATATILVFGVGEGAATDFFAVEELPFAA